MAEERLEKEWPLEFTKVASDGRKWQWEKPTPLAQEHLGTELLAKQCRRVVKRIRDLPYLW